MQMLKMQYLQLEVPRGVMLEGLIEACAENMSSLV
jgi:hypothetical protein